MYREKVEKLQGLHTNFNIFAASPPVPADLLRSGCVPPLPVIGDYLIWGFSILKTALREGIAELPCVSLDFDIDWGLQLALRLENRTDRYTWREKADLLLLLRGFSMLPAGDALLSLVQSGSSFIPQTELFLRLPNYLQAAVNSGALDMKTAERIEALPENTFTVLHAVLEQFSFSSRRQFLIMLNEVCKRDEMQGPRYNVLLDELASAPRPLELLRIKRYPQLSEMEADLQEFRRKHLQGSGIELIPPPNFEGDAFTLQFAWETEKQLSRVIEHLSRLQGSGNELFRLLY